MLKSEIRKAFLEKRKALTKADIDALSRRITGHALRLIDADSIRTLHCFLSIEKLNEIDTSLIFRNIWAKFPNVRTAVPRINSLGRDLEHLEYRPETELAKNNWGIAEPTGDRLISPEEIDLVLVPLLCFDRRGHRVGYGKGYYDRFLTQCRPDCIKAGLSLFPMIEKIDDAGPHDIPLDACVLPDGIVHFSSNTGV